MKKLDAVNQDPLEEILKLQETKTKLKEFKREFYEESKDADTTEYASLLEAYNDVLQEYTQALDDFNNWDWEKSRTKSDIVSVVDQMDDQELYDLYMMLYLEKIVKVTDLPENYEEIIAQRLKTQDSKTVILREIFNKFELNTQEETLQIEDDLIERNTIQINERWKVEGENMAEKYNKYIVKIQKTLNDIDITIHKIWWVQWNFYNKAVVDRAKKDIPESKLWANTTSSPFYFLWSIKYPREYFEQWITPKGMYPSDQQKLDKLVSDTRHEGFHRLDKGLWWFSKHPLFKQHFKKIIEKIGGFWNEYSWALSESGSIPNALWYGWHPHSNEKEYFATSMNILYSFHKNEINVESSLENSLIWALSLRIGKHKLHTQELATNVYNWMRYEWWNKGDTDDKRHLLKRYLLSEDIEKEVNSFLSQDTIKKRIKTYIHNLRDLMQTYIAICDSSLAESHSPEQWAAYKFIKKLNTQYLEHISSDTYSLFWQKVSI